jgi:hypothetical protein
MQKNYIIHTESKVSNQTKQQLIVDCITRLFVSRNQQPIDGLIQTWVAYLSKYDEYQIRSGFERYILTGDDFPSLPKIIKSMSDNLDIITAVTVSWNRILGCAAKGSSKGLSDVEKEALNFCTADRGLSAIMEANEYQRGNYERSYKCEFELLITGEKEKYVSALSNPDVREIVSAVKNIINSM